MDGSDKLKGGGRRMWVNLINEACGYCGASISLANYRTHQRACKARTAEQRSLWLLRRIRGSAD